MSAEWFLFHQLWRNKETVGVATLAAGLGNPKTRAASWKVTKWSARNVLAPSAYHTGMAVGVPARNIGAVLAPPLARATGAVAAGILIGSVGGMAISRAVWGKSGQKTATDLYTGKVSFKKWTEAISELPRYYIPSLSGRR